jgi:predicted nucleotidyltransferase
MNERDILDILQVEKPYLQKKFGLLSIGLFGSYVRGTQGSDSDIDVLVELAEPRFDFLVGVQTHLENKLGRRIDIVRKRPGLSRRFLRQIEKTVHYA